MKIQGPVQLTIFPHLGLRAREVTLANVPGGKARVMLAVGDIDLSLQLVPLLTGRIALDKISLNKPVIALEVDPDGNPNWQFGKKTAKSEKKGTLTLPSGTEFHGITVTDGTVTYENAKTGTKRAVEHVNLAVDITTVDAPVTLHGDLILADKKIGFEGRLATLKTFLGSGLTDFGLAVDSELMKADFHGQMLPDGTTDGRFQLSSPSLRDLSGWLGQKLPAGGLGAISLKSRIINKEKTTRFATLKASLDGQNLNGDLTVDAAKTIPVLTGSLNFDRLNLTPYLSGGKAPGENAAHQGWSREKISFALIKEFNGDLTLSTGSLTAQSLHLGRTSLHLTLDNGVMHAALNPVTLYGGTGEGETIVDVRGPVPQFTERTTIRNIALRPFLKDMLKLDSLDGQATVTLDMRFAGASPNEIMHNLWGKGTLSASNGRLRGVDLGQVARTVSVFLGGDATSDVASTEFHTMGASFSLNQGVLHTDDFRLSGPVVEMTGQGGIDIGGRSINFRVRPGAAVGSMRFGVPFRIQGNWDKLHYSPDVEAMVNGAVDNLKKGASALEGLFTSGPKNGQKPGEKKKSTGDKLKDFFGIH
jgi:AsmA protein